MLRCIGAIIVSGAILAPLSLRAQEGDDPGFTVTSRAEAPTSAEATAYADTAGRYRIDTDMTYATGLDGELSAGAQKQSRSPSRFQDDIGGGSALNVFAVVFALLVALLLWMRFGGSGMVLARTPSEVQETGRTVAPDSWRIDAQARLNPNGLLDQLAALPDRREAMVQLLRHCLMRAGDDSDTRFARADTEREAFARLPHSWHHHRALKQMLRDTELVHYGGRDVTEDVFDRAFALGGVLLGGQRNA